MKYLKNVATLKLNEAKCTGCGTCMEVCPHNVFELKDDKVMIADLDACMECGACAGNCPFGAVEVHKGVGCAVAILYSLITGEDPSCG